MTTFILSMSEELEKEIDSAKVEEISIEFLFHEHYEALVRYANTIIKDVDEAEDFAQSVFVDLWNDRNKIDIHTSHKAYLYKGVYFKCMNKLKRQKVESKFIQRNPFQEAYQTDGLVADEIQKKITMAVNALPEQCRKIFSMSRFENLKYHEIAEKLSLSPKTIENQMGKALKIMRTSLQEYLNLYLLILIELLS